MYCPLVAKTINYNESEKGLSILGFESLRNLCEYSKLCWSVASYQKRIQLVAVGILTLNFVSSFNPYSNYLAFSFLGVIFAHFEAIKDHKLYPDIFLAWLQLVVRLSCGYVPLSQLGTKKKCASLRITFS